MMRSRTLRRAAALYACLVTLAAAVACGSNPLPPSPTPPPAPVIPPPVTNSAPVVTGITVGATRAEVDQLVNVSATVQDADTPVDTLTYNWTANFGSFVGSGRQVQYRLPKGAVTPVNVLISVEVVERYTDYNQTTGAPFTRENRATATAPSTLRVHDSPAEVSAMAIRFLVDYFGNSAVSPDMCVSDFWDGCRGKQDELNDIVNNRKNFKLLSAQAHVATMSFDPTMTSADLNVFCDFHDISLDSGKEGHSIGGCLVGAVYQQQRWWLCYSNFDPTQTKQFVTMDHFFRMGLIDRRP